MLKNENHHVIKRILKLIYLYILPVNIIILLLGVSQLINRPMVLGSEVIDLGLRLLLCVMFFIVYRRLSNITNFRPTSVSTWTKADLDILERIIYISLGIFYGIMVTLLTRWIIQVFLPTFIKFDLILAILNGLAFSIPVTINYHVFKP